MNVFGEKTIKKNRWQRQGSQQATQSTTRSPSVLSLARPHPSLFALPLAVVLPLAATVDFVASSEPFSISEGCETQRDVEGPLLVESALLRRRGDTNPSWGWCSPAGRSFLLGLAAVGLVVLLALLVLCVVVANRELGCCLGRLDRGARGPNVRVLQHGCWGSIRPFGGRCCYGSRISALLRVCCKFFSCDFVCFAALLFAL